MADGGRQPQPETAEGADDGGGGGAAGGAYTPIHPGLPGDANTGGGGGGCCGFAPPTVARYGGTGGSGIVIIRWQKVQA